MTYEYRDNRKKHLYHYIGLDGQGVLTKWYDYSENNNGSLDGYAECRLYFKNSPAGQTVKIEQVISKLYDFTNTKLILSTLRERLVMVMMTYLLSCLIFSLMPPKTKLPKPEK